MNAIENDRTAWSNGIIYGQWVNEFSYVLANEIDQLGPFCEQQLTVLSTSECEKKKLLMQLYEITLGALIYDYKERKGR